MDPKQGRFASLMAPLGQQIVNPNNAVTDMMNPEEAAKRKLLEEEARRKAAAEAEQMRVKSAMEAAAAMDRPKEQMSSWNPFVWLFGQPGAAEGGVIGK